MALVVQRERLEDDRLATVRLDVGERVLQDGEVAQTEEVHLQQPELLAGRVVELRDDRAVLLALHDRDVVDQAFARHDDAGRVDAPLTLEVLQASSGVDDALDVGVRLVEGPQLAGLVVALVLGVEDAPERDVLAHDRRRHDLGDAVAQRVRVAQHPGGVLDRLLGLDGAVGDDLRDAVVAVPLGDVADDVAAAALVEVDVDVGHRDALGVEEALEEQAVLERVEVGDAQCVRHDRPGGRSAAGTDPDALVLRPADEVGHHEEVAREAHLADDADLVLGLLAHLVGDARRVAQVQTALDLLDEPGRLGLTVGNVEPGHEVGVLVERDLAPLGDQQGVVAGFREVAPDVTHLGCGLEVEVVGVELEPGRVGQRRPRLHAQQRRVRLGVRRVRVVQVVGGDQRQVQLLGQPQQVVTRPALDVEAVVHQLAEVVVGPEDVAVVRGRLDRGVVLAETQQGLHLAGGAAGGGDDAVGVGLEQLAVHARLEVEALDARQAGEPEQVVHAGRRLGQHRHVRVRAGPRDVVLTAAAPTDAGAVPPVGAGRQVGLDADDRSDPAVACLAVEVVGPEDVAVVGDRDGRHLLLDGGVQQLTDPGGTVEHGVLGVHVQVHERVGHTGAGLLGSIGRTVEGSRVVLEVPGEGGPADCSRAPPPIPEPTLRASRAPVGSPPSDVDSGPGGVGSGGGQGVQGGERVGVQRDRGGRAVLLEVGDRLRPRDGQHHRRPGQQPGEGQLRRGVARGGGRDRRAGRLGQPGHRSAPGTRG